MNAMRLLAVVVLAMVSVQTACAGEIAFGEIPEGRVSSPAQLDTPMFSMKAGETDQLPDARPHGRVSTVLSGPWSQTLLGFEFASPPPWGLGNQMSLFLDEKNGVKSSRGGECQVVNMHGENYGIITAAKQMKTVEVRRIDDNRCVIVDERIPNDWYSSGPSDADEILTAHERERFCCRNKGSKKTQLTTEESMIEWEGYFSNESSIGPHGKSESILLFNADAETGKSPLLLGLGLHSYTRVVPMQGARFTVQIGREHKYRLRGFFRPFDFRIRIWMRGESGQSGFSQLMNTKKGV